MSWVWHMSLHNFQGFILKMNCKLRVPLVPKSCPLISSSPAGHVVQGQRCDILPIRTCHCGQGPSHGRCAIALIALPPPVPKQKNTLHYLVNKRMNKRIDKNSVFFFFFFFVVICFVDVVSRWWYIGYMICSQDKDIAVPRRRTMFDKVKNVKTRLCTAFFF